MLSSRSSQTAPSRAAAGLSCAAGAVGALLLAQSASAQMPSPDFFPIGVFAQPINEMTNWKNRGINTLFQYEPQTNPHTKLPTVSMKQWGDAATQRGLYYARLPSENPANDLQEPNLIAWTQLDEPDLTGHSEIPQESIDIYQNLKAISPSKPVWINFAGNHVTQPGRDYTQWAKAGDWLSTDWYPIAQQYYNDNSNPKTNNINFVGQQMDVLRAAAKGVPKKFHAIIESSDQFLKPGHRAPTVEEFRGMIWEAVVHGATGIIYFPQRVPGSNVGGGFDYDDTPPHIVTEMVKQNALLKSLGAVLNATYNPTGRGIAGVDPDLDESWRSTPQGDYFFVLNLSWVPTGNTAMNVTGLPAGITSLEVVGENRTVPFVNGQIFDTFGAYDVHIYRAVTTPGGAESPVPEPAGLAALALATAGLTLRRRPRAR